ncbi:hypothetical protein QT318_09050 [Escherichia coli]|nr:hypothetical protein [Escherichia coli]
MIEQNTQIINQLADNSDATYITRKRCRY